MADPQVEQDVDLEIRLEKEGQPATLELPFTARVVSSARLINYDINQTKPVRFNHVNYLRDIARDLKIKPWHRIALKGSASNDRAGRSALNFGVAEQRAKEAKAFLTKNGVPERQIFLLLPQVNGPEKSQRPEDRFVEVEVVEPVNTGFDIRLRNGSSLGGVIASAFPLDVFFQIRDFENRLDAFHLFQKTGFGERDFHALASNEPDADGFIPVNTPTAMSVVDFQDASVEVDPEKDPTGRTLDVKMTLGAGRGFVFIRKLPGEADPLALTPTQHGLSLIHGDLLMVGPPKDLRFLS
jgi:outer membrane protein OmpA-like peptidoglycan-associated protein